jgi:hypothetical protein
MKNGKLLHSVLRKDGKNYAVDLDDWGKMTLQGDDLVQFELAMSQIVAHFEREMQNKNLIITPIIENITTDNGTTVSVVVGSEFSQSDSYVRPEIETEWYQRMSQDPNIIKFNDREIYN